jgi:hypothetical protein
LPSGKDREERESLGLRRRRTPSAKESFISTKADSSALSPRNSAAVPTRHPAASSRSRLLRFIAIAYPSAA